MACMKNRELMAYLKHFKDDNDVVFVVFDPVKDVQHRMNELHLVADYGSPVIWINVLGEIPAMKKEMN